VRLSAYQRRLMRQDRLQRAVQRFLSAAEVHRVIEDEMRRAVTAGAARFTVECAPGVAASARRAVNQFVAFVNAPSPSQGVH